MAIRDICSTSGTYVNENLLREDELIRLRNGDVLKVGNTEFNFLGCQPLLWIIAISV